MELCGKVALVTGGTKGIGAATAVALGTRGADVALVARHADEEACYWRDTITAMGRRCLLLTADIGRADEATAVVQKTIAELGSVDVLVHCAGGAVAGGLFEVSPETWNEAFDVHVHAVYHLSRAAAPTMKQRREGAIILISSVAGLRSLNFNLAYQVVKGALPHFTRALARELAEDNIRVNCVAPGIIRTRFHQAMTPEQKRHNLDNRVPLHCEGTPEQVASLIVEMATNDYITGETFCIDGGLTMRIA